MPRIRSGFSAAILAFEMLTGRRLFRGKNDYQTIALVRACDVPSLRSYNPAVPVDLENILLKALSKDIKDRYQNAEAFADALLDFLFSNRLKVGARDIIDYVKPIRDELEAQIQRWRARAENPLSSREVADAAQVLVRSCEGMLRSMQAQPLG